jgi:hypothetical protein
MKKSSMSSPQPIPMRCSDLKTDIPPELAELPFLPNTDPLILRLAVSKALSKKMSGNQSQPDGTLPRPESVSS